MAKDIYRFKSQKSSFRKVVTNGVQLSFWQKNFKNASGERLPWFHVRAEKNGVVGILSFYDRTEAMNAFQSATKAAGTNNFTISQKAIDGVKRYHEFYTMAKGSKKTGKTSRKSTNSVRVPKFTF